MARRQPGSALCGGLRVEFADAASFLSAHHDIFVEEAYRFPSRGEAPSIVDLGANIGLATLWFKLAYPRARVLALEPDPAIFSVLERNVRSNGLTDVELLNCAAWKSEGELAFHPDGADGGRSGGNAGGLKVRAVAVDRLLAGREIDFLKIDIEGAETEVLPACRPILPHVGAMFVEYHMARSAPSRLGELAGLLEQAGFRLRVRDIGPRMQAYGGSGFDMQLNIFAWRPA